MSFIQTTEPCEASGEVAVLYRRLQGRQDYLPNYARVYCHRPALMAPLAQLQETLKQPMEPRMWALIALAVAREIKSSYCSLAFGHRLLRASFSAQELHAVVTGQADAPLGEAERVAMEVASKIARDASTVSQQDIDGMRQAGFTDAGIFDVVAAAAWRCFFAKIPDALGALPDAALGQLDDALLQQLVVGRDIEKETSTRARTQPSAPGSV